MKVVNIYLMAILICLASPVTANSEDEQAPSITKEDLLARGNVPHDDFLVLAIPKAGTHFLGDCMRYLLNKPMDEGYDWVEADHFTSHTRRQLIYILALSKANGYIHKTVVPHFEKVENTFVQIRHKWFVVIRDPRDALISLLFHMEALKDNGDCRDFMVLQSAIYDDLSFEDKLTALITGSCCQNYLDSLYKPMLGWMKSPHGLCVRFEDLVGPKGGGTAEAQLETLLAIANHINCCVTPEELEAVAWYGYAPWDSQQMSGRQHIRGQIGSWRKFFNDDHISLFKALHGKELIQLGYEKDNNW